MSEFIKEINATSRFAGLSLGGNEGLPSAVSVCAWQSGFPLRVSFASGKPDYDSERYDMMRSCSRRRRAISWYGSHHSRPILSPPDTDVPMIVLGTPGIKLKRTPRVYIPVGTPGIDHAGVIIRVDTVVSLPLRKLRQSKLPRAADVLASIEAAL